MAIDLYTLYYGLVTASLFMLDRLSVKERITDKVTSEPALQWSRHTLLTQRLFLPKTPAKPTLPLPFPQPDSHIGSPAPTLCHLQSEVSE